MDTHTTKSADTAGGYKVGGDTNRYKRRLNKSSSREHTHVAMVSETVAVAVHSARNAVSSATGAVRRAVDDKSTNSKSSSKSDRVEGAAKLAPSYTSPGRESSPGSSSS